MQNYVTTQINQAIDQTTRDFLNSRLKGLRGVLHNYVIALQSQDPASIKSEFGKALDALTLEAPSFQPTTRPYIVLPEYVQIMNLLIAQLKDGIEHGASLGIPDTITKDYKAQLVSDLSDGAKYVPKQITAAEESVPKPEPSDDHYTAKLFNNKATVDDALIPAAADPSYFWQFVNVADAPRSTPIPPDTRILYSPAQGCSVDRQPVNPVVTTLPLTRLTVWGSSSVVVAMQTTYGNSPSAQPRMGQPPALYTSEGAGRTLGSLATPDGGSWANGPGAASMGYITTAYGHTIVQTTFGHAADHPQSVGFVFSKDGKTTDTGLLGGRNTTANFTDSFSGEVLATVTVVGKYDPGTDDYDSWGANCVVFGWRLASSLASPQQSVPASWTGSGAPNQTCGKTFTATAPQGYGIAEVTLSGAGGGGSTYNDGHPTAGGPGAQVSAEFSIKPGQPVTFIAGCAGATGVYNKTRGSGGDGFSSGGNGGGGPGSHYATGGGGGGASALCLGSGSCETPLVVASGGAGAGGENDCLTSDSAGSGGSAASGSFASSADAIVQHGSSGSDGNLGLPDRELR